MVDQKPLQTARKLAALASTPEEQDFSHEALRLSDYEVDLAFADALREATEHPAPLTPEQRDLGARAAKTETVVRRAHLYEAIVELLHGKETQPEPASASKA